MKLYKKIIEVMKDIEYLQKDDKVAYQNINYKAISEEKVTETVRKSLIKHGLAILPIKIDHTRQEHGQRGGMLTTVDCAYKLIDVDTGDSEEIVSSGTGVDTQDKGIGKALTYAYKYLLLRTFAIPTGDDPDKVSSLELDVQQEVDKMAAAGSKKRNLELAAIKEDPTNIHKDTMSPQAIKVEELRKRITDCLMKIAGGDLEKAKDLLEDASTFEGNDGTEVHGVRSTAKLTGKWLRSTYGRVKEMAGIHQKDIKTADQWQEEINKVFPGNSGFKKEVTHG